MGFTKKNSGHAEYLKKTKHFSTFFRGRGVDQPPPLPPLLTFGALPKGKTTFSSPYLS